MIDFKCPKCGETLSVPDSLGGQAETCPKCGNVAAVPEPQAAPGVVDLPPLRINKATPPPKSYPTCQG